MGKFVVKHNDKGDVSFRVVAGNGEVVGVSETYASDNACLNGIESVRKNAIEANVEDQTKEGFEVQKNPKWEIYKDKKGEFRFRLKARNGEIILVGEGYVSKAGCKNGIDSIKRNVPDSPVVVKDDE